MPAHRWSRIPPASAGAREQTSPLKAQAKLALRASRQFLLKQSVAGERLQTFPVCSRRLRILTASLQQFAQTQITERSRSNAERSALVFHRLIVAALFAQQTDKIFVRVSVLRT